MANPKQRREPVALPFLRIDTDTPMKVKFTGAIQPNPASQSKTKPPASIAPVVFNDADRHLLVPRTLAAILERSFPLDGRTTYVGRWFEITRHARLKGARQGEYSIYQLFPPVRSK